jgi:lysophospholipase L1-like esterase
MKASRRRTIFSRLTAAYLLAVCAWALYALYGAEVVQALYDRRVGFLSRVLVPKELPSGVDVPIQYYRARFGDLMNAGLVASTVFYVLVLGLLSRFTWIRIPASNLSVVVLLLLGLEVGIRALGFEYGAIARPGLTDRGVWAYDETKGWFHQPHASGQSDLGGPDLGVIEINSLGLRDREFALEKPDGVKRILVLGDSYVFGVGVDRSHVFSTRLGELLDASAAQRFEVINMGVSGYSTDQEYLLFRELGKALDPDFIILVVCHNDYFGNSTDFIYFKYYKPYFSMDERGHLKLENREVPRLTRWQRVKLWLGQESQLWNSMRNRRSDIPAIQGMLNFFRIAVPNRSTDRGVELTASIIRRFEREARARGVPVLVMTTAGGGGVDEPDGPLRRRDQALRELLTQEDIKYFDLWPALVRARQEGPEEHWGFPGNTHWNIDAHRVAAEAVYEHLKASGAL